MKLFADFYRVNKNDPFDTVELNYSITNLLFGKPVWWCRICKTRHMFTWTEAFGKTKFEAYRNVLEKMNPPPLKQKDFDEIIIELDKHREHKHIRPIVPRFYDAVVKNMRSKSHE